MATQFNHWFRLFVMGFLLVPWHFAMGADKEKIIARCKDATALVDLGPVGSGSAFCVDSSGIFLTNHHVVDSVGLAGHVKLVLNPGEKRERIVGARVVAWSEEHDIAVLLAKDTAKFVALSLAPSTQVKEVDSVTAYGFPFGKRMSAISESYPTITINTGKVTALRLVDQRLRAIQIDAGVNPGNSGGPLVNQSGAVVGIIAAGNQLARIAFAIPSDFANELLSQPALLVDLPDIEFSKRNETYSFPVEILQLSKGGLPDEVELEISDTHGTPRTFREKVVDRKVRFSLPPAPADSEPLKLRLTARDGQNLKVIETPDIPVRLGRQELLLSEIRKIERRPDYVVVACTSGRKIAGSLTGLEHLTWDNRTKLDLNLEDSIDVHGVDVSLGAVQFEFAALRKGKPISTARRELRFKHAPQAAKDNPNDPEDPYAPILDELIIEARIGGVDKLIVTPTGLLWHHEKWEKPGETDGATSYVTVNNRRWNLKWNFTSQSDQLEDATELFPLKLGAGDWDYEMMWIRPDLNSSSDLNRCKVKGQNYGTYAEVEFDDVATGTSLYRFHLMKRDRKNIGKPVSSAAIRAAHSPSVDLPPSSRVDVLSLIDPSDHVLDGGFTRVGGDLISSSDSDDRLVLPVVVRGGYELTFEFTRTVGNEPIVFKLPIGDETCLFTIGGNNSEHGIEWVDGREMRNLSNDSGAVTRPGVIENGHRYTAKFQVTRIGADRVAITADLDGRRVVDWKGNPSQLSTSSWHSMPIVQGFTLRTWRSALKIHRLDLNLAADANASQLGGDWKNSINPVADNPPSDIEASCASWNGRNYYCPETMMDLNSAQRLATKLKGRLVLVSSAEEAKFLSDTFSNRYIWTAVWRKTDSAVWRDERNRPIPCALPWAPGQPEVRGEQFTSLCTYGPGGIHTPGMHDYKQSTESFAACIEWGEEFPSVR